MDYYDFCDLEDQADELEEKIIKRYNGYGVSIKIIDTVISFGRFIFEIKIPKGTRVDQIGKYAKDVQMSLKLPLFQVVQKNLSVFIVASKVVSTDNSLRRILTSPEYAEAENKMGIAHPVGFDTTGKPVIKDLALYPHILIAGTTGSGKSIASIVLLTGLLSTYLPDKINLLICDKAGDLLQFAEFPHLSHPIIQDSKSFLNAMICLKEEMERRISLKGTKEFSKIPRIVCAADEFTSFISGSDATSKLSREVITEILRRGRHAKIHTALAAHNPTQQRLKLDISDIPTKMCFRVSRLSNSLTVLSEGGAEKLLGKGDMLFQSSQGDEIQRIQGAYITPKELKRVLSKIKSRLAVQSFDNTYKFTIDEVDSQQDTGDAPTSFPATKKRDFDGSLFSDIILWTLEHETVSCNMITDTFKIGWRRANDFLDKLRKLGIVGDMYAKQPRAVLPVEIDDLPLETVDLLISHGHTEKQIKEVLNLKIGISITT